MKIFLAANVTPRRAAPNGDESFKARREERPSNSVEVSDWCESEVPASLTGREQALRFLARWLVAAARKDVPGRADRPAADPRIPVDVAVPPEVGLDGK